VLIVRIQAEGLERQAKVHVAINGRARAVEVILRPCTTDRSPALGTVKRKGGPFEALRGEGRVVEPDARHETVVRVAANSRRPIQGPPWTFDARQRPQCSPRIPAEKPMGSH